MQTVRLGRTNVEVSAAGLGCGGHSRLGMTQGATAEQAADVVRAALDLGITFVDTAPTYGAQEAVGLGLGGRRDGVFLSTKVTVTRGGFSRAAADLIRAGELVESLEASLRALRTDHVDVLHLHGVTPAQYDHCVAELLPEMQRQQAAGKIRFLGITEAFGVDTGHEMLARALPRDQFDVVMVGFNLLNPSARARVFPLTLKHDVGTLIMFAVRRALSQPKALRETLERLIAAGQVEGAALDLADPLAFLREAASSELEAAYRFCRHEPGAQVVLTGTGSVEHLKANIAAIQAAPPPAEIFARLAAIFGSVGSVSGN
jgi:L-galactose dehydrogenase